VKFLDALQAQVRGELPPPPVAETIGMRLVRVEPGQATFELDVDPERHANPMGTLHGGILCDVADGALGCAFASTLDENETFTTLDLKINFLRPFWSGLLTATGRVVHRGKTVGMTECDITDSEGRLIARASSTCMALRGDAAAGR
jgi:uncharacterized protein (TIGR00369 family)